MCEEAPISNGFATPMRGKSMTCRKSFLGPAVYDRRVEDRLVGKSETCRSSAWHSHQRGSLPLDLDPIFSDDRMPGLKPTAKFYLIAKLIKVPATRP